MLLLVAIFLVLFVAGKWVLNVDGAGDDAVPSRPVSASQPTAELTSKSQVTLRGQAQPFGNDTSSKASDLDSTASEGGGPSGIELYAGTRRPFRIGVVVPDDYVLPVGYVRHYQMNEDGTPLPPILMYHPDFYSMVDAGIDNLIPNDLIVPGDQLPPGLKPLMLEVPKVVFDGGLL